MNENPVENELLAKLESLEKRTAPVYRACPLTEEEILKNTFAQIDVSEVRSVILRGSRASGRENPYSDVDLVALTDRETGTILRFADAEGTRYHLFVFSRRDSSGDSADGICRLFYGMRPIYDPEGTGKHLTELLNAAERKLCTAIPKENAEYRDYLFQLVELLRCADADTAFFTRVKILYEFPAFLSAYNGFNLIGFKTTLDCLIRDDRALAMLYADALRADSGREEIDKLLRRAFAGPCGLNVLNTDFSHSEKSYDIRAGSETMYQLYVRCSDFMDALRILKPDDRTAYEFYLDCRQKYPKLFRRLRALSIPSMP